MGHHSPLPGRCHKRHVTSTIPVVTILILPDDWGQELWPLLILNEFDSRTLATGVQFFTADAASA